MNRTAWVSVLAVAAILTWWWSLSSAEAAPLKSFIAYDSGPIGCGAGGARIGWVNVGPAIRIHRAYLWIGAQIGTVGDLHFEAWVQDATVIKASLGYFQWDHYSSPTGPHHVTNDFGSHWVSVEYGEGIGVYWACAGNVPLAHFTLAVWYSTP